MAQVRSVDRDKLPVQLVASVWKSILEAPDSPREELEDLDNAPRFRPALIGVVRITGDVLVPRIPEKVFNELTFACLGKRLRVTMLQKQD
jgi:hypothetical protein